MHADEVDLLRERGLRVTAQRLAVLRAVSRDPHATADAVADTVRTEVGSVSLQAVYDALGVLADADLIRRIEPAHSPARFEPQTGDNHHHIICRECGSIVDAECALSSAPCLVPVDGKGFELYEAEVIYWGRCPDCQH